MGYAHCARDVGGTEVCATLADTFHLERTEALDGAGKLVPVYVLLARPPTGTEEEHSEWCKFFLRDGARLRDAFRIALQRFDIAFLPVKVWCDLCKSRIHCTARCPWPAVEGWLGITPKDLGVRATSSSPPTYSGPAGAVITPIILAFRRAVNEHPAPPAPNGQGTNQAGHGGRGRGLGQGQGGRGGRGGRGARGGRGGQGIAA
ncbi:hypothetical protein C2E23DRAFT_884995 [Lenzites betulinus]|nr:hypothetical protein C2E23DRAFT_884995 [Lenzites betulinus]